MGLHILVLQPHIVVGNDVRKHYLKLARRPGKDDVRSDRKRKKLGGGGDHIKVLAILLESHFREAEGIEHVLA